MNGRIGISAVAAGALLLTACTAAQVISTATVAIGVEIAAAQALNWQPGVVYGDVALTALSCIGTEFASSDAEALKLVEMAACATKATSQIPGGGPTEQLILAAITAALDGVLAAYGVLPPTPAMVARARSRGATVESLRVRVPSGKPNYFERRDVLKAARGALAARQ